MVYSKKITGGVTLKIAICEDELFMRELLSKQVTDFMSNKEINFSIDLFATATEFYKSVSDYDLILMDYALPDGTGMEIAKKIRLTNKKATIVFITAYSEYVFESFEVDTFRYLLKPVNQEELNKMLNDYINNFEQFSRIEIPLTSGTVFVNIPEIMYIESNGRYSTVRLNSTTYISTKPLSSFQAEINSYRFFRTHRTFLVNMKYIAEIDGHIITLTNGEKVEISRRNLATFNKCYMNFLRYYDM